MPLLRSHDRVAVAHVQGFKPKGYRAVIHVTVLNTRSPENTSGGFFSWAGSNAMVFVFICTFIFLAGFIAGMMWRSHLNREPLRKAHTLLSILPHCDRVEEISALLDETN